MQGFSLLLIGHGSGHQSRRQAKYSAPESRRHRDKKRDRKVFSLTEREFLVRGVRPVRTWVVRPEQEQQKRAKSKSKRVEPFAARERQELVLKDGSGKHS